MAVLQRAGQLDLNISGVPLRQRTAGLQVQPLCAAATVEAGGARFRAWAPFSRRRGHQHGETRDAAEESRRQARGTKVWKAQGNEAPHT